METITVKGHNSTLSKQHNRGLVLRLIATGTCGSRIELARATGLAKMTVTNIIYTRINMQTQSMQSAPKLCLTLMEP